MTIYVVTPPSTLDFLGNEGFNLALGLVTSCCGFIRLHDVDLQAVGLGEGP